MCVLLLYDTILGASAPAPAITSMCVLCCMRTRIWQSRLSYRCFEYFRLECDVHAHARARVDVLLDVMVADTDSEYAPHRVARVKTNALANTHSHKHIPNLHNTESKYVCIYIYMICYVYIVSYSRIQHIAENVYVALSTRWPTFGQGVIVLQKCIVTCIVAGMLAHMLLISFSRAGARLMMCVLRARLFCAFHQEFNQLLSITSGITTNFKVLRHFVLVRCSHVPTQRHVLYYTHWFHILTTTTANRCKPDHRVLDYSLAMVDFSHLTTTEKRVRQRKVVKISITIKQTISVRYFFGCWIN